MTVVWPWQDDAVYLYLRDIDRAGLMWEWLRRDPEYIAWHVRASRVTGGRIADPDRWGLHFRRRPGPVGTRGTAPLACRS